MKNLFILTVLIVAAVQLGLAQAANPNALDMARFVKKSDDGITSETKLAGTAPQQEIVKKPERGNSSTEVAFTYSHQSLSNGRGTWKEGSIDVIHKFSTRKVLYGSFVETERFERRDRQANIGFYQPLDDKWTILFEASASPTHRVIAKYSAMAQLERSFGDGWIGHAGYRRTEHVGAKVNIAKLGVEKYWGMNRAAYSLSINNLESTATSPSQRFQYNRYYGADTSVLGISFVFGKETENTGPNSVLQSDIYNISVTGKHWFNRNWGTGYGLTFHKQGEIYNRRGLQFGIHYKF